MQWDYNSRTQGAVHAGTSLCVCTLFTHGHHFHAAHAATHHLRFGGVHDGRGNGRTYEQSKPHQHQAGDEFVGLRVEHVAYYR